MRLMMKLSLISTFAFLLLSEVTMSHFVEFKPKHRIHLSSGRREATRWSRKIDFLPDSSIPNTKLKKLSSKAGHGKNIKPTKKTTISSGKTGMWGR